MSEALLDVHRARKAYGGTLALIDGNLSVKRGSIHGIVGPNGAGKSTLMKIIGGHVRRDGGTVRLNGDEIHPRTPLAAQRLGIVTVPQEISLAGRLSVAANIQLGVEPHRGPFVTQRGLAKASAAVLESIGLDVPLSSRAGELRADQQRMLMFAQGIAHNASLMILDEPTAGLNGPEAELVVGGMERLRESGQTQLFVSHRFDEILRLCDRVTTVRDGRTVTTFERGAIALEALVAAVAGGEERTPAARQDARDGTELLYADKLVGRELNGISFGVRAGEIVGVAGLAGSGVDELLAIIGGATRPKSGSLAILGRPARFREPADALRAGVSYLPADRTSAALLTMTIQTNVALSQLNTVGRLGFLNKSNEGGSVHAALKQLGLETRAMQPLSSLSGGNRQKALIARAIFADSRILAFADPTVGVDVHAKQELHAILAKLAADGRAILISSSEPEELPAVADRVIVLRRGMLAANLAGSEISAPSIVRAGAV